MAASALKWARVEINSLAVRFKTSGLPTFGMQSDYWEYI